MNHERRKFPRFDLMAQIRVECQDDIIIMEVSNISRSGLFVSTPSPSELEWVRMGQKLEADIFMTENLENVRVSGVIVRIVDEPGSPRNGFAISFTSAGLLAQKQLKNLVALYNQVTSIPPKLPWEEFADDKTND